MNAIVFNWSRFDSGKVSEVDLFPCEVSDTDIGNVGLW